MRANFGNVSRLRGQRLADLEDKAAEIERRLAGAWVSLEGGFAEPGHRLDGGYQQARGGRRCAVDEAEREPAADAEQGLYIAPMPAGGFHGTAPREEDVPAADRTEVLVTHGRPSARRRSLPGGKKVAIPVVAGIVGIVLALVLSGGPSWPSSVSTVQAEITQACRNPDVMSEPGQVNFACGKSTRQMLWVFALLTSGANPRFHDRRTGRMGLEPITPAQGSEVAWSLNLHHPYRPSDPLDSIQVAARALNNIIGGAATAGANGNPNVQPGLESSAPGCARYTGSAALRSRPGFPSVCARPVSTPSGQAALVADAYRKWVPGAPAQDARDAATLFENAGNPGDARVQAILKHLPLPGS